MPWSKDPSRYDPKLLYAAQELYNRLTAGEGEATAASGPRRLITTLRQQFYAISEAYVAAGEAETVGVKAIKRMTWRVLPGDPTELRVNLPLAPLALAAAEEYLRKESEEIMRRAEGQAQGPRGDSQQGWTPAGTPIKAGGVSADEISRKQNEAMETLLRGELPDDKK